MGLELFLGHASPRQVVSGYGYSLVAKPVGFSSGHRRTAEDIIAETAMEYLESLGMKWMQAFLSEASFWLG